MKLDISNLIAVIAVMAIVSQPFFFTFSGLLGIDYQGSESSPLYVIFIVSVAFLSFLTYLHCSIKNGFTKQELIIIIAILLIIINHFIWVVFDSLNTELFPESLIFFLLLGLPGFFSAAIITKSKLINHSIKIAEPIFLIIASGIIVYSLIPTLLGIRTASIGGATYQALSYYSSLTFGFFLLYEAYIPKHLRYDWTNNTFYKAVTITIITSCAASTLIGGGRGAFILLCIYILFYALSTIKTKGSFFSPLNILRNLIKVLVSLMVVQIFIFIFWDKDFIQTGLQRATAFISPEGNINLESGSSGRDIVYNDALTYIDDRPFLGYGSFGGLDNTLQAHNIFLDIILQYGYFSLIIVIAFTLHLIVKAIRNWTIHTEWCLIFFCYPLVMLMFSGYYLHVSFFIFGISFLFLYKKKYIKNTIRKVHFS